MGGSDLTFSIIIPTYNRARQLQACVDALSELRYPRDRFEVIVVDDGSDPPVARMALRAGDFQLRVIHQPNSGPGPARNRGAVEARGRLLAFTDDDCLPDRDWLTHLEAGLTAQPRAMLGGRTINHLDNPFSEASQIIVQLVYAHYNRDPNDATFFTSNNIAVAAADFAEVGGFDAQFVEAGGEDRELCDRWRHLGRPLVYAPEALVQHGHDLDLASFWSQHFNYGRGAFFYHRRRSERGSGRLQDELGFYSQIPGLLRAPLARLPSARSLSVVSLLFVWQAANACGYFFERFRPARFVTNRVDD